MADTAARNTNNNQPEQCLACPFFMANPLRHLKCHNLKLKRPKDVKEHINNKHRLPLYCSSCGCHDFDNFASLEAHGTARQCTPLPGGVTIEGIDQRQQQELTRRADRRHTKEEQWMQIWDIIFPNKPRPDSPFIGNYIEETLRILVEELDANAQDIFESASANEPRDQQMARDVIEQLFNHVLSRSAAINGWGAPRIITLTDPNQNLGDQNAPQDANTPAFGIANAVTVPAVDLGEPVFNAQEGGNVDMVAPDGCDETWFQRTGSPSDVLREFCYDDN